MESSQYRYQPHQSSDGSLFELLLFCVPCTSQLERHNIPKVGAIRAEDVEQSAMRFVGSAPTWGPIVATDKD